MGFIHTGGVRNLMITSRYQPLGAARRAKRQGRTQAAGARWALSQAAGWALHQNRCAP